MQNLGKFTKFNVPNSPLEAEDKEKGMFPTKSYKNEKLKKYYEKLWLQIDSADPKNAVWKGFFLGGNNSMSEESNRMALKTAVGFKIIQLMDGEIDEQIDEKFVEEFIAWIQGKSRYNLDKETTPWGSRRLVGPEFDTYLRVFVGKKMDYIKDLTVLKAFIPQNLTDAWKFFKYICCKKQPNHAYFLPQFNYYTDPYFKDGKYPEAKDPVTGIPYGDRALVQGRGGDIENGVEVVGGPGGGDPGTRAIVGPDDRAIFDPADSCPMPEGGLPQVLEPETDTTTTNSSGQIVAGDIGPGPGSGTSNPQSGETDTKFKTERSTRSQQPRDDEKRIKGMKEESERKQKAFEEFYKKSTDEAAARAKEKSDSEMEKRTKALQDKFEKELLKNKDASDLEKGEMLSRHQAEMEGLKNQSKVDMATIRQRFHEELTAAQGDAEKMRSAIGQYERDLAEQKSITEREERMRMEEQANFKKTLADLTARKNSINKKLGESKGENLALRSERDDLQRQIMQLKENNLAEDIRNRKELEVVRRETREQVARELNAFHDRKFRTAKEEYDKGVRGLRNELELNSQVALDVKREYEKVASERNQEIQRIGRENHELMGKISRMDSERIEESAAHNNQMGLVSKQYQETLLRNQHEMEELRGLRQKDVNERDQRIKDLTSQIGDIRREQREALELKDAFMAAEKVAAAKRFEDEMRTQRAMIDSITHQAKMVYEALNMGKTGVNATVSAMLEAIHRRAVENTESHLEATTIPLSMMSRKEESQLREMTTPLLAQASSGFGQAPPLKPSTPTPDTIKAATNRIRQMEEYFMPILSRAGYDFEHVPVGVAMRDFLNDNRQQDLAREYLDHVKTLSEYKHRNDLTERKGDDDDLPEAETLGGELAERFLADKEVKDYVSAAALVTNSKLFSLKANMQGEAAFEGDTGQFLSIARQTMKDEELTHVYHFVEEVSDIANQYIMGETMQTVPDVSDDLIEMVSKYMDVRVANSIEANKAHESESKTLLLNNLKTMQRLAGSVDKKLTALLNVVP